MISPLDPRVAFTFQQSPATLCHGPFKAAGGIRGMDIVDVEAAWECQQVDSTLTNYIP